MYVVAQLMNEPRRSSFDRESHMNDMYFSLLLITCGTYLSRQPCSFYQSDPKYCP